MKRLVAAACAALLLGLAACSGADDAGPLYPGGTTPVAPSTTEPGATEATGPSATNDDGSPTTDVVTTEPGSSESSPPPSTVAGEPGNLAEHHPLDGLSAEELETFRAVLAAEGLLDGTQFPYVALEPPDKDFVLGWAPGQPIPRRAFGIARRDNATYEAVVDLVDRSLVSWTEKPGVQPGFVSPEYSRASGAATQDPRFLAGLEARGIQRADAICLMFAAGAARGPEEQGRRLGRVTCYLGGTDPYYLSRPIEGLYVTVDLESGEVVSVSDSGPVEVPAGPPLPDPARQRPPLNAIGFDTSNGTNVTVDGSAITWAGWSLRWRADRRTGIELEDLRFDGGNGPQRMIYEAYLSDLFVPYQDPDPAWAFRTLLDSAEFGLGNTLSRLTPGIDCPQHAVFMDATIPSDDATGSARQSTVCVFERPTGDPAWRHAGSGTDAALGSGLPETELVIRFISTIGNYDYIIDYVLGADGAMRFKVFAAGIVLQKAVDHHDAGDVGVDDHGVLVGDGLLATNHDHYMNFRIDLDVGETTNRMLRAKLVPEAVTGDPGRTEVWKYTATTVDSELEARMTPSPTDPEDVVFESQSANGPLGHHPGLQLDFGDAVAIAPGDVSDEPGLRRGGWAQDTVWVTPYEPGERFASGLYVPDGSQPAGLAAWTEQDRKLLDTDLVLWFTVGFHHIVRTEDLPTMPVHEATFGLTPFNMFPYNPLLDFSQ